MEPTTTGSFDEGWRRRALAGEPAAVRLLAERALPPLWSFCLYRVGRDRQACEDAVQETLLQAIRRLEDYDPARSDGEIHPWLVGLARNEIRRVRHASQRALSLDDLWERVDADLVGVWRSVETAPLADEALEREETRTLVNCAMAQIPPHYRDALEAKYVLGRSVREIAASLGQSEKAAESMLTRARDAFRAAFVTLAKHMQLDPPTTHGVPR